MVGIIEQHSRVGDIVHRLSDPIDYLTGIIGNFVFHRYDPESSAIRIGISGGGVAPNYKIEKPCRLVKINVPTSDGRILALELHSTPAHTFSGRNHREMKELDDSPWHPENWSANTMTFAELKALLGSLARNGAMH
jgi:hypothetical protein